MIKTMQQLDALPVSAIWKTNANVAVTKVHFSGHYLCGSSRAIAQDKLEQLLPGTLLWSPGDDRW